VDIAASFSEGIPVFTLSGRFDGSGAKSFDQEALKLDGEAAYLVIDLSGVTYLSSVAVRSLLTIEKRLKVLDGGVVLTGMTEFVRQVLHVSGLGGLLRTSPTLEQGIAMVRASVAAGPVVEREIARCHAKVRRLPKSASVVEWWERRAKNDSSTKSLLGVSLENLGYAFGAGQLGETSAEQDPEIGRFVSTPCFAGVAASQANDVSDFIVGDTSILVPIQVSGAIGVSGTPAYLILLHGDKPFSLLDAFDGIFDFVDGKTTPPVLGYVAIAQNEDRQHGIFVTSVSYDPAQASSMDRDGHLEKWPEQNQLPSGRRIIGGGVTLVESGELVTRTELADAIRSRSTLDVLRDVIKISECGPVTRAYVWVFVPSAVKSGADKLLQVNVESGGEWRPEWDAIVRRLYHDCRSVTLAPLHGGYMSKTFRAVAYDREGRRTLPTVLKIGPTALTDREQKANRDYVSRFILNNGTTVLGSEHEGEWAGLRYNFLGINGPDSQLVWLREHYLSRPVPEVLGLFEQLLTRVLKPWYGQPKWEQVSLYHDHTPLRLFPELIQIAERELRVSADALNFDCPELGVQLPNPFHFLKHEYSRRATQSRLWYTAICHGDLNLQNVLVDERNNLYVIDFSETRPRNAVSDFARMEPILKFEMPRLESDEELRELLEFEEGLMSVTRLDEPPPLRYRGNDPLILRAHAGITFLRRCADRATLFEQDIIPYWLALLEWTYSVVCYTQVTMRHKRYAACSAALIVRSILELERVG
jgi:anti-anti-sigma factor